MPFLGTFQTCSNFRHLHLLPWFPVKFSRGVKALSEDKKDEKGVGVNDPYKSVARSSRPPYIGLVTSATWELKA